MHICFTHTGLAHAHAMYYMDNQEHLKPWEPAKSPDFYSVNQWVLRLHNRQIEMDAGHTRYFVGLDNTKENIIALCSLTDITRGAMQSAYLGYSISKQYQGQGLMSKLVSHAINHAFNDLKLHRIMANYMPNNTRSATLLHKLGFEKEGYAKQYLKINGQWEDHILTSLINQHV